MSKPLAPVRAALLLFLCGCGGAGGDYTVSVVPVVPTNQSPFDGVDNVLLSVIADDGTEQEFDLGTPESGLTLSGVGIDELNASTLLFEGKVGTVTVSRGKTAPLTAKQGQVDSTVMYASINQVGWIGSLLEPVVGPLILPVGEGRFHVFGGVGVNASGAWTRAGTEVQVVSLSDPSEDLVPETIGSLPTWTDLTGAEQQGWFGSSTATISIGEDAGKIFIGGGAAGVGLLDAPSVTPGVWLYNSEDGSFESLRDAEGLSSPRCEAATVVDAQGVVVMWGGWTQDDSTQTVAINATVEAWDPDTRKSTSLDDYNYGTTPMFDAAGAAIGDGGTLFCGGGLQDDNGQYATWYTDGSCRRVSLGHDIAQDTDLPVPLAGHQMITLQSGKVLVTGGATQSSEVVFDFTTTAAASPDAWLYDPDTSVWSPAGSMNVARVFHKMANLPDGRVLIAGGSDEYAPGTVVGKGLSCVEVYDPLDNSFTAVADCSASSDAEGLAGRAATPSIGVDPEFGIIIAGGSADFETAQNAINVVFFEE